MIYFIESIPGGGKTYYSRNLQNEISNNVIYYREEECNPIDLQRQAVLSKSEYYDFLQTLDSLFEDKEAAENIKVEIECSLTKLNDLVFLPFMHIRTENKSAKKLLYSLYKNEVNDGMVVFEKYRDLLLSRISNFLEEYNKDINYIFEGALFHNPLITILGFYDMQYCEIRDFYEEIFRLLKDHKYVIKLIVVDDIDSTVRYTAKKRKDSKGFSWQEGFEMWFLQSNNFRSYKGVDGIITFAKEISKVELDLIRDIRFEADIIERGG